VDAGGAAAAVRRLAPARGTMKLIKAYPASTEATRQKKLAESN
jgi:hypothetical protein